MSKILDITIEEGATFSKLLTFRYNTLTQSGAHPITGAPLYTTTNDGINLTGYTVKAQIRKTFEGEILLPMQATIISASEGRITLGVSAANTKGLAEEVTWSSTCSRTVKLGYYDVILTKNGVVTRVLQGTVFISRAITD